MRRVLLSDFLAGAGALACVAPPERAKTLALWLDQTGAAHKYMKRFGRPHPLWGTGTLEARAGLANLPRPAFDLRNENLADAIGLLAQAFKPINAQIETA